MKKLLNNCLTAIVFFVAIALPLCGMELQAQPIAPVGMLTNNTTQGAWTRYEKQGAPVILEWHNIADIKWRSVLNEKYFR